MLEPLLKYWPIALFLLNLFLVWVIWSMRKEFATKADLAPIQGELAKIDKRVSQVESDLDDLPTRDELAAVKTMMAELRGDLKVNSAEVKGLRELFDQNQYLARLTHEQVLNDR